MIHKYDGIEPNIHKNSFIAENSTVIGDVTINEDVSIWFGAVLRSDVNSIYVGRGTNIQDNSVIHVSTGKSKTVIGEKVTIGHGAIIHGATIGNSTLIGMGSIILDDAEIGNYSIVGAGSVVPPGKKIPSGVLCIGSPAKVIRELTEEEKKELDESANSYIELYKKYK